VTSEKSSVGLRNRRLLSRKQNSTVQKCETVIENSTDFVYLIDRESKVLMVNKAAASLLGRKPKEIEGRSLSRLFPKKTVRSYRRYLAEVFQTGRAQLHPDTKMVVGERELWTSDRLDPIKDKKGRVIAVLGVSRDITERKKTMQILSETKERYRIVADNTYDWEFWVSPEGKFLYVSPSCERITGHTPIEFMKDYSLLTRIIHPEDLAAYEKHHREVMQARSSAPIEFRITRPEGGERWIEHVCAPVFGDNGAFLGNRGSNRDTTERKQAEEALRLSEAKYRALVENTSDFIFAIGKNDEILAINTAGAELLGRTVGEILGKSLFEACPTKIAATFSKHVKGVLQTGEHQIIDEKITLGNEIWLNTRLEPLLDDENRIYGVVGVARDVTEHNRNVKKIQESLSLIRATLDSTADGILVVDRQGNITSFNRKFTELWHVPEDFMQATDSQTLRDFVASQLEDQEEFLRKTKELYDDSQSEMFDSLRFKDGRVFERYSQPQRLGEEIVGRVWSFRDITEREKAQKAVKENEQRYRKTLDNLLEGGQIIGFDWRYRYVNNAVITQAHRNKEELLGHTMMEVYPGIERTPLFAVLRECMKYRLPRRVQNEFVYPDGDRAWFDLSVEPVEEGLFILSVDITDRKRLEAELKEYSKHLEELVEEKTREVRLGKKRLEYLIESNPAVIHLAQPLPDWSDFYATFMSSNIISLTGYEPQKFIGILGPTFWASRVHPDDLPSYRARLHELWKKEHLTTEYRFQHKNGAYRWIREEARIVRGSDGQIHDIIGYWTDVTEHKLMEEEIVRSQKLAAIGETATMVAHDLRNPLQAITGAIDLLKSNSTTYAEKDRMLKVIQDCVDYSESIVRDLVDYSKEIHLQLTETTPRSITESALTNMKFSAGIVVENTSKEHPVIKVDSDRLRRVLINIIENAVDAMPRGGTLTVSSKEYDGNVEITVSDTGLGIPEQIMRNIWKPLQTSKAKGLGLGLAISKRMVDAHGGSISLKSQIGKGTTVTIRLPIGRDVAEVKRK